MKKALFALIGLSIAGMGFYLLIPTLTAFFATQIDPTTEEGKKSVVGKE